MSKATPEHITVDATNSQWLLDSAPRSPVSNREFLVKVEMWSRSSSRKSDRGKKRDPTLSQEDSSFRTKLKEKWLSAKSANVDSVNGWRPVVCKLSEDGPQCTLSIYNEDSTLHQTVTIHRLNATNIRGTDRSLFRRKAVLAVHCQPGTVLAGSNHSEPIYLAFPSTDACNTWLVLLRSYAAPDVYGPSLSAENGGLYRMWRQIGLEVSQGKNLGLRLVPDTKLTASPPPTNEDGEESSAHSSLTGASSLNSGPETQPPKVVDSSDIQDSDIFCEICLDGVICGKTTTKRGSLMVDWFERFTFSDLPSFNILALNVWREKRGSKPTLLGVTEITLANFRRSEWVDGSWAVFAPTSLGEQIGEMKLRVRVDEEIVLPSPSYRKVLAALEERNYLDLLVDLEQRMRYDHVSPHIISLAVARRRLLPDLAQLADREVSSLIGSPNTLFRGNTVFTKTMELTMQFYGRQFLEASIGPVIRRMYSDRIEIEMEPTKGANWSSTTSLSQSATTGTTTRRSTGSKESSIDSGTRVLAYWCSEFWNQIYITRTECPIELRVLFQHIRTLVDDRLGKTNADMPWRSVSAFCFLRFLVPAMLNPHLFNLAPGMAPPGVQRSLTLVAKVLQSLANLNTRAPTEEHMRGIQEFTESNMTTMLDYLSSVSTVPPEYTLSSVAGKDAVLSPTFFANLTGDDKIDRLHVISSLRSRLEGESLPTLYKDSIPLLPHLSDIPKDLAVVASAVVRSSRASIGVPLRGRDRIAETFRRPATADTASASSAAGAWSIVGFSDLCLDVEAQALKAVAQLAAAARQNRQNRPTPSTPRNDGTPPGDGTGRAPNGDSPPRPRYGSQSSSGQIKGSSISSFPSLPTSPMIGNNYMAMEIDSPPAQNGTFPPTPPGLRPSIGSPIISPRILSRKSARPSTAPSSTTATSGSTSTTSAGFVYGTKNHSQVFNLTNSIPTRVNGVPLSPMHAPAALSRHGSATAVTTEVTRVFPGNKDAHHQPSNSRSSTNSKTSPEHPPSFISMLRPGSRGQERSVCHESKDDSMKRARTVSQGAKEVCSPRSPESRVLSPATPSFFHNSTATLGRTFGRDTNSISTECLPKTANTTLKRQRTTSRGAYSEGPLYDATKLPPSPFLNSKSNSQKSLDSGDMALPKRKKSFFGWFKSSTKTATVV